MFLCAVGKVSASYCALISWLLSLVAMDTDVIEGGKNVAAPFRLIGLQQMLLDGQLALHAAVVPVRQFTARDLRSRSKVLYLYHIQFQVCFRILTKLTKKIN